MTSLLKRVGRWLSRLWSKQAKASRLRGAFKAVIIVSPQYDTLTSHTASWLAGVRVPRRIKLVGPIADRIVTRGQVADALKTVATDRSIMLFGGHGGEGELFGSETNFDFDGGSSSIRPSPDNAYDTDMLAQGPTCLYAFCCSAGERLGPSFATVAGRAFLGYGGKIPLNLSHKDCVAGWKMICETVCNEILSDGDLMVQHESLLKTSYEQALSVFQRKFDTEGKTEFAVMLPYLIRHHKLVRFYAGGG